MQGVLPPVSCLYSVSFYLMKTNKRALRPQSFFFFFLMNRVVVFHLINQIIVTLVFRATISCYKNGLACWRERFTAVHSEFGTIDCIEHGLQGQT